MTHTPADPAAIDTYPAPKHGWTCFHCGETFTTFGAARDHFGATPEAQIGCLIKQILPGEERGLLMELRKAEAAVEALRERGAKAEERHIQDMKDALENAMDTKRAWDLKTAAEARVAELAGALGDCLDWIEAGIELTPDVKGVRALAKTIKLCDKARTVLTATPEKTMERARATSRFLDLTKLLITRRHLTLIPPSSGSGRKSIKEWSEALAKLDTLGKEGL